MNGIGIGSILDGPARIVVDLSGPFLLDVGLKGLVLLAVTLALSALLRGGSASARHRLWALAFVGLLILPLLSAVLPAWRVPVLPEVASDEAVSPQVQAPAGDPAGSPSVGSDRAAGEWAGDDRVGNDRVGESQIIGPGSRAGPGSHEAANATASVSGASFSNEDETKSAMSLLDIVLIAWMTGVLLFIGRLALSHLRAWRIRRDATPLHDLGWKRTAWRLASRLRVTRPVRLLRSDRVRVPGVWGVRRPALLLPPGAEDWSESRRRVVLLHELAHVKRRDCLIQLLTDLACALHWPNPLTWLGARRLLAERERACDEAVVSAGTPRTDYAGHLLEVARSLSHRGTGLGWAGVAMARPSELEGRLLAILDGEPKKGGRTRRAATAGAFGGLALLLLPLAVFEAAPVAASGATGSEPAEALSPDGNEADPTAGPIGSPALDAAGTPIPSPATDALSRRGIHESRTAPDEAPPRGRGESKASVGGEQRTAPAGSPAEPSEDAPLDALEAGILLQEADTTVEERIFRVMGAALADEDAGIRRQAAHALGNSERPEAVEPLARALRDDPDVGVRRQAAWGLGMIEDPAGVDALRDALDEEDAEVRRQAAWALGMIEDPSAVEPLSGALDDEDAGVRSQAAWALGMIEDPGPVDALTRILRNDPEAKVRRQAAWALGMIEDGRAAEALIDAFEADADAEVREQAMWALGMVMGG